MNVHDIDIDRHGRVEFRTETKIRVAVPSTPWSKVLELDCNVEIAFVGRRATSDGAEHDGETNRMV